jgi:hypothetical protein
VRRTRTILAACAVALVALACAANASAWNAHFRSDGGHHNAQVEFRIHTEPYGPEVTMAIIRSKVCGGVVFDKLREVEGAASVGSANGWAFFAGGRYDHWLDLSVHLSREADKVTAKGLAIVTIGNCRTDLHYEAVATGVHGLP